MFAGFIFSLFGLFETQEPHQGRCGVDEATMLNLIQDMMRASGIMPDADGTNTEYQNSTTLISLSGDVPPLPDDIAGSIESE